MSKQLPKSSDKSGGSTGNASGRALKKSKELHVQKKAEYVSQYIQQKYGATELEKYKKRINEIEVCWTNGTNYIKYGYEFPGTKTFKQIIQFLMYGDAETIYDWDNATEININIPTYKYIFAKYYDKIEASNNDYKIPSERNAPVMKYFGFIESFKLIRTLERRVEISKLYANNDDVSYYILNHAPAINLYQNKIRPKKHQERQILSNIFGSVALYKKNAVEKDIMCECLIRYQQVVNGVILNLIDTIKKQEMKASEVMNLLINTVPKLDSKWFKSNKE